MKIVSVVGARPQFVKFAPVDLALKAAGLDSVLVHTGQHYDPNMSDVFFDELSIAAPRHHLGVGSGPHGKQTGDMMAALEPVLIAERPDWVLAFGDTNSTLAAALVAAKLHIAVGHVEAGLRSFNRRMPEEINRVITDHLSTLLFAPTQAAVRNLASEGIAGERVLLSGDVMYDASLMFAAKAERNRAILRAHKLEAKGYVLATVHRAENTDDPTRLSAILAALADMAREIKAVLPLHPRTRKLLSESAATEFAAAGGILIDPVGYLDMVSLERNAKVIVTDSGGVQKEAYFHRVPCVTLRDETEWVELVEAGWNRLVSPDNAAAIRSAVLSAEPPPEVGHPLYGAGNAASLIAGLLGTYRGRT